MKRAAIRFCLALLTTGTFIKPAFAAQTGNLFVSYTFNNEIHVFSSAGVDLGAFATTGLNHPRDIAFDSSGDLFVANQFDNTVHKFGPTGADLGVAVSSGLNQPNGLAIDQSNNIYVANFGMITQHTPGTIRKFSPTGADLGVFVTTVSNSDDSLAFDSEGNLLVGNFGSGTIKKYSPAGVLLGTPVNLGNAAGIGFAVDSQDNLYVPEIPGGSFLNAQIHKYDPNGIDLGIFANHIFHSNGVYLTFDSSGNLFASGEDTNTIEEYSASGTDLGVFATTTSSPTSIAFQPIPEPSTFILAACGALGVMLARRKRSQL